MDSKYGMVKRYVTEEGDEILFVFNAMTFVIYMNYTGRDLMSDFTKLVINQNTTVKQLRPELLSELESGDLSNVTEEEIAQLSALNSAETNQFMLDYIAALIATAKYPQRIDYCDAICQIPISMLYDKAFANELFELMQFGLVPGGKKKA